MLSREKAQEVLKAAQLEQPDVVLATRINTLAPDLAKKTLDFLQLDAQGKPLEWTGTKYWEERRAFAEAVQKTFYAISPSQFDGLYRTQTAHTVQEIS